MKAHEKLRYVRLSIDCVRIRTYTSPITAADRPRAEEAAKEWGKTMKFTAHQINLPANVSVRPGQYARFSVCEIGRAHVGTPVTNAPLVWRLPVEKIYRNYNQHCSKQPLKRPTPNQPTSHPHN